MYTLRTYNLLLVVVATMLTVTAGCTSRYRMSLYQTVDEVRRKVKVEGTQYVRDAAITPDAEEKLQRGVGNVIVLSTGTRGTQRESAIYNFLSYDEYLRCEVYFQLPPAVTASTISLKDNSFLWILGRYDQPPESRLFVPDSGLLVIDSIAGNRLFGTVAGRYKNGQGVPLTIDGKFKIRVSK